MKLTLIMNRNFWEPSLAKSVLNPNHIISEFINNYHINFEIYRLISRKTDLLYRVRRQVESGINLKMLK